jgi:hypothetical protein
VREPQATPDIAPSPIKTPRWEKPKDPITFPEHIAIHRRCWPKDWEGPEALPDTMPERWITTRGLLHRHVLARCWWHQKFPCAWWMTSQLGTLRGRYDEYSS